MEIIKDLNKFNSEIALTITIGNFDGVHLGHQELINKVISYKDTKSALMTFDPNPKSIFNKDYQPLFSLDNKKELLNKYNIDYMFVVSFNEKFMKLSKEQFINKLISLNVKRIIVGSDFKFGHKASGTTKDLMEHFEVIVYDVLKNSDEVISSSLIKDLLLEGNIKRANELLTYPYFIKGEVVHGNKVGRKLGFPTANVSYTKCVMPKNGVYIVSVDVLGECYYGIANIGNNPTINYSEFRKLEVFILDFNKEIYGNEIKVNFIKRIRDELKFNSKEELIEEMDKDLKLTKDYVKNNKMC